ncbi:36553_t:CDS:2 [Gigaspora margarita]|uniref:36553_t:CDS:1 n=1 Tax=Gigaspora margarita TaxID=4874 RepID=A0ABN7UAM0_GIGMA|nr:36553_t:CDS:2 [Gigaspora margarita]
MLFENTFYKLNHFSDQDCESTFMTTEKFLSKLYLPRPGSQKHIESYKAYKNYLNKEIRNINDFSFGIVGYLMRDVLLETTENLVEDISFKHSGFG